MKKTYQALTNNSNLYRNPAWSHMKLKPLPLYRDESQHKYVWEPTGEILAYSTTQIAGGNKTPQALAAIEATRHKWEPRGVHVHHCLEQFLLGDRNPDPGDYEEWVKPLLEHEYWKEFEPWAVEYMVCDLEKSIGGQLDLLGYDHAKKELVLLDLKTQGSAKASRYKTDAQLGSYVHALNDHCRIMVDTCRTIWARPGKCVFGPDQNTEKCTIAWIDAWEAFKITTESFD